MVNQRAGRRGASKEIRFFLSRLHAATTFPPLKSAATNLVCNVTQKETEIETHVSGHTGSIVFVRHCEFLPFPHNAAELKYLL